MLPRLLIVLLVIRGTFWPTKICAGRLWTAVIFLIVALVSIVGFAGWRSAATQKEAEAQMSQAAAKLKAVQDWATMSELTITRATAAVLSKDPNVGIQFKDINDKAIAEITELKKQIEAMDLTEADRAQMTKIGELRATVLAAHKKSADLKAAGDDVGARLTDFVRRADRARDQAERARLLYVAATRARERKILPDEIAGGTFTISNLGAIGGTYSTPIINPPQSAILGVHATKDRPVVENGQIVIRPMMYLALSYDHRIVDGREAVTFLVKVKDVLEDPARLMLDV